MTMLKNAGITLAIITGRDAACVEWRMKKETDMLNAVLSPEKQ